MPPAPQRFTHHQLVADALPLVLVVLPGRTARPRRPWRPHLAEQLLARLIEADHRVLRIVGQQVGLDHVLHAPDVLGVGLGRDAPRLNDPRLDVVFFSAWRTVSVLTASTSPKTTSSSASSCKVQWQRPSGGSLQASWTNFCSTSPLILILSGRCGWGWGRGPCQKPSVTKCRRTRPTVRRPTPKAETICSSVCALAAVSSQQEDASMGELAGCCLAGGNQVFQVRAFLWGKGDSILVHRSYPVLEVRRLAVKPQDTAPTCQMKMDDPLVMFRLEGQPERRGVAGGCPDARLVLKALKLVNQRPPAPPEGEETVM